MPGRRPVARPADDDGGAGLLEQLLQAGTRGDGDDLAARPGRRTSASRAPSTCSAKCVTRIRCGRPAAIPASTAAPTSSTWTWTFQSPSPPTTTSESPRPARACLEVGYVGRRRRRAGTSPRTPAPRASGPGAPRRTSGSGCGARRSGAVTGVGRRPVSTVSAASRITLRPRPPASTTPASRSTASCSGVRASASRAAAAASVKTSRARAPGSRRAGLGRLGGGPDHGEDGALDGRPDGGVRAVGGLAQRPRHDAGVALLGGGAGDGGGQRAEHLAEDHAAVAAGAEQGAPTQAGQTGQEVAAVPRGRPRGSASRAAATVRYMLVPVSPSGTG